MTSGYSGHGIMEIQKYCAFRYGPQQLVMFNVFNGTPMCYNFNPETRQNASFILPAKHGSCSGIATMPDSIMTHGTRSCISFTFDNAGLANEQLYYEVGDMRPLSKTQWEQVLNDYSRGRFNLCRESIMADLNTVSKNERWIVREIECCVYNPRGRGGHRPRPPSALPPQVLHISWERCGIVMSKDFEQRQVSVRDNRKECGLLLVMTGDSGTLTYFAEGKPKHHVNGLAGDYVWVVSVCGKSTDMNNFICRAKKYF